ncbi:dihydrofolate reductase family protein [Brevibacterium yomogidense]|uniref:dihydrofolate reductase family protein n=1 Tax=Brevibacterium yomogidense TaxID=946573 RepID=UPI0018DF3CA5
MGGQYRRLRRDRLPRRRGDHGAGRRPYRDLLRRRGISYLVAGQDTLDPALALEKLHTLFGMERVMVGGGGVLNWSFLRAGLVDEISLVVSPFADGDPTQPGLFTAVAPLSEAHPHAFSLLEARELRDSVLLLRYRVEPLAKEHQTTDSPKGHHGTH